MKLTPILIFDVLRLSWVALVLVGLCLAQFVGAQVFGFVVVLVGMAAGCIAAGIYIVVRAQERAAELSNPGERATQ